MKITWKNTIFVVGGGLREETWHSAGVEGMYCATVYQPTRQPVCLPQGLFWSSGAGEFRDVFQPSLFFELQHVFPSSCFLHSKQTFLSKQICTPAWCVAENFQLMWTRSAWDRMVPMKVGWGRGHSDFHTHTHTHTRAFALVLAAGACVKLPCWCHLVSCEPKSAVSGSFRNKKHKRLRQEHFCAECEACLECVLQLHFWENDADENPLPPLLLNRPETKYARCPSVQCWVTFGQYWVVRMGWAPQILIDQGWPWKWLITSWQWSLPLQSKQAATQHLVTSGDHQWWCQLRWDWWSLSDCLNAPHSRLCIRLCQSCKKFFLVFDTFVKVLGDFPTNLYQPLALELLYQRPGDGHYLGCSPGTTSTQNFLDFVSFGWSWISSLPPAPPPPISFWTLWVLTGHECLGQPPGTTTT